MQHCMSGILLMAQLEVFMNKFLRMAIYIVATNKMEKSQGYRKPAKTALVLKFC